ncbi:1-(5-phosphoribosyl)-5-[(5-phosphoribosylamino)methylideneamino]imidazole-4-carboxamide isomerase [Allohahella marinimesophila]|uniref:1-(5-phosphoribosyl)-5-[(5-phosphoribosylamino)methylideneamino] imidazole-4-carboxamide isomerase n=1 Tax=Allohahella marinimesophila TaxID=1054972 RepID=A0ABP7Q160_9GAMM
MLVIPAIDLKDGQCVRLRQGRMDESTVFSTDPLKVTARWIDAGARRIHLVDLNGAFAGEPVNGEIVRDIVQEYPDLESQIGGGIRDLKTVEHYLNLGVDYVIIGTMAVKNPDFVREACQAFPGKIIVGIDAKDGWVAVEGWAEVSNVRAETLARNFADSGVNSIIYTDIDRDGMMQGVNVAATEALAGACELPIIASGGITSMEDIVRLQSACLRGTKSGNGGIVGAISGRAIYEGTLDFAEAQAYCDRMREEHG